METSSELRTGIYSGNLLVRFHSQRAGNSDLCQTEQTVEQTVELPVIAGDCH